MPKEYIRGFVVPSSDPNTDIEETIDARVGWGREDEGGIVQMAIFRNDGTYKSEHEEPMYMTLDRTAINRVIKVLRRARDQAYGRDE